MRRIAICVLAFAAATLAAEMLRLSVWAADPSPDRVVAMYFHRTKRCPTCLKMGSYSEEAVKTGFAQQIEDGTVQFYYVDFQDEKNAALTKAYGIGGPTLIVVKVAGGKVKEFKNLQGIWSHVADKPAFLKYVQENVEAYLE